LFIIDAVTYKSIIKLIKTLELKATCIKDIFINNF